LSEYSEYSYYSQYSENWQYSELFVLFHTIDTIAHPVRNPFFGGLKVGGLKADIHSIRFMEEMQ